MEDVKCPTCGSIDVVWREERVHSETIDRDGNYLGDADYSHHYRLCCKSCSVTTNVLLYDEEFAELYP